MMNPLRTARAVAWSFLGIRNGSGLEDDMRQLNPLHVVVVALVIVALIVAGLITLVHWIA
jgi:amino acid transporter